MVVGDVKLNSNSNTKEGCKGETIWIGKCKWKKNHHKWKPHPSSSCAKNKKT
jgi:hypothetical protein